MYEAGIERVAMETPEGWVPDVEEVTQPLEKTLWELLYRMENLENEVEELRLRLWNAGLLISEDSKGYEA